MPRPFRCLLLGEESPVVHDHDGLWPRVGGIEGLKRSFGSSPAGAGVADFDHTVQTVGRGAAERPRAGNREDRKEFVS
ncbi:MAG: hypothetical protein DIU78_016220 [Pseudomonadota bacterium]